MNDFFDKDINFNKVIERHVQILKQNQGKLPPKNFFDAEEVRGEGDTAEILEEQRKLVYKLSFFVGVEIQQTGPIVVRKPSELSQDIHEMGATYIHPFSWMDLAEKQRRDLVMDLVDYFNYDHYNQTIQSAQLFARATRDYGFTTWYIASNLLANDNNIKNEPGLNDYLLSLTSQNPKYSFEAESWDGKQMQAAKQKYNVPSLDAGKAAWAKWRNDHKARMDGLLENTINGVTFGPSASNSPNVTFHRDSPEFGL